MRTRRKRKYCICDGKCGSAWFPSPCLSESVTWPTCCDAFSPPIQVKMKIKQNKITFLSQIKIRITFPSCTLIWGKVQVFRRSTASLNFPIWNVFSTISAASHASAPADHARSACMHAGLSLKARVLHVNTSTRKCCSQRKTNRWTVSLLLSATQQN